MAMFDHNDTWLYSFISVLFSCINEIKVKDDFFSFFCTRKCYLRQLTRERQLCKLPLNKTEYFSKPNLLLHRPFLAEQGYMHI